MKKNPNIILLELRKKLQENAPFTEEDVDNARELAVSRNSIELRALYSQIKKAAGESPNVKVDESSDESTEK
jgi:hypothetical protein